MLAATDRLQDSDFHSRRAKALWNSSLVFSDRACQGEQVQAFRCYEHNPPTSRRLVTNFRAAECPLLPKRILRCCRADEGRLFYTTFAGAKALATDGRVLCLIEAMLKAGSYSRGRRLPSECGTPQGGVVTPLTQKV